MTPHRGRGKPTVTSHLSVAFAYKALYFRTFRASPEPKARG